MKKYRILVDCHGYKGRYWEKDKIVELEDDDNPPPHFQLAEDGTKSEAVVSLSLGNDPQKPLAFIPGKPAKVKGGFGSSISDKKDDTPMTAGKALKNQK